MSSGHSRAPRSYLVPLIGLMGWVAFRASGGEAWRMAA